MLRNITDIAPLLGNELKAGDLIRDMRWPNGVRCAYCNHEKVHELKGPNPERRQWKCAGCRKKFSVTTRSIFEGSHIPLGKWIYAIFLMCSSKKGVSANQLHRELGITYKAAWFLCHRIRYAMTQQPLAGMLGQNGGVVELDETFVGGKERNNLHRDKGPKAGQKAVVMTLIDQDGDAVAVHVPDTRKATLQSVAHPIVDRSANIVTDAHLSYQGPSDHFHASYGGSF